MGTIPHKFETDPGKRTYRRHSVEFKQTVVEQSYVAGASVARLAQQHQINANQIFAWRKWARDQRGQMQPAVDDVGPVFLPVTVSDESGERAAHSPMSGAADVQASGNIDVTIGAAKVVIHGRPDPATLRAVLTQLLR
jgi:transposase